jgi:glycosyltransferase involved in cell wall biosynthesis
VVAYGAGGALETVRDGVSGVFFPEQTEESLLDAVRRAAAVGWDRRAIRVNAERFGVPRFIREFAAAVGRCLAGKPESRLDTRAALAYGPPRFRPRKGAADRVD